MVSAKRGERAHAARVCSCRKTARDEGHRWRGLRGKQVHGSTFALEDPPAAGKKSTSSTCPGANSTAASFT